MPAKRHTKIDGDSMTPRKKGKLSQKRLDALIRIPNVDTKLENLEQTPFDPFDSRTEARRQELLLWADEYEECKEKTYKEMMAEPDPEADFGNDESDAASINDSTTSYPTFSRPSRSQLSSTKSSMINYNLNVNYSHSHSIMTKNGDLLDLNELVKDFTQHTAIPTAGRITMTSKELDKLNKPWRYKMRSLKMDNMNEPLRYSGLDIDDPPLLKYSNDMDGLIRDWEDSSHLIVNNVPIPLKYWKQIYRYAKPEAWKLLKNHWSNWKFFVMAVKVYKYPEDFWFKYSDLNEKKDGKGPRKRWSYTVVLKALRQQRQNADVEDAAKARIQYNTAETFAKHFSYRKGNRQILLTSTTTIARQFRKMNNRPRYWDLIAEEEEEESEEIDQLGE